MYGDEQELEGSSGNVEADLGPQGDMVSEGGQEELASDSDLSLMSGRILMKQTRLHYRRSYKNLRRF